MRRWAITGAGFTLLLAAAAYGVWSRHQPGPEARAQGRQRQAAELKPVAAPGRQQAAGLGADREADTAPPGLPITTWGPRDCFAILREPGFVTAKQGDALLASDEPVLGLVVGGEVRAYSTNQLNNHEMILDEVAGTPILVTY